MLEFQEKKKIRDIIYSKPVLLFLLILLVVLGNATYSMYLKVRDTGDKRNLASNEQAALTVKARELETQIADLKTDRGIEEEIRKKYRVVKDGESVIIVVDENRASSSPAQPGETFIPLFDRIKKLF